MDMNHKAVMEKADPGAIDHGEGLVSFAIYAPYKKSIHLIGSFNDWNQQQDALTEREPGYWVTALHLDKGSHPYQFVIDQELVVCDPYAHELTDAPGDHEQPAAIVRVGEASYRWEHDDWLRHRLRDLIIYEMHFGDFTAEGTFASATEKLGHLTDLGISAIELMPVYGAAPDDYWGYEPTFLLAPRRSYGSPDDLRRFVDAAHAHHMAVILDMVLAHTGHGHPFNRMYPYENSPWYGSGLGEDNQYGLPTFDYLKEPTNFFVRDVEIHWLTAYHIDGFRYDYLAGIGADAEGKGLPNLMDRVREIQPDAFFIGECIPENPQLVNDSGLSAIWHTRSRLALQALITETDVEPYSGSRFSETVQALEPATQEYREPQFMINYVESHDDQRLWHLLQEAGFDDATILKKSMLAATILMTIPGEPMLYQGQEWGEASPARTEKNAINWQTAQTEPGEALLAHYQRMSRIRRSRSSIRRDDFAMPLLDVQQKCIVYQRLLGESDQVVVTANFSGQKQNISVPLPQPGYWHEPEGEPFEAQEAFDCELEAYTAIVLLSGKS
ncbi:MAG: alpha-amylase family glycosyl hydrolase [Deltaproteobacteria bacterium]|nr:alpha-amylase family glycosyl hydrolase [Deltaproteobacteria bacterium]